MALYVTQVPSPAVGKDWSYVIPGNYLLDVVAVQATLSTPASVLSAADSSGNGLTATLNVSNDRMVWGSPGPYSGGAKDYSVAGVQKTPFVSVQMNTVSSALLGTQHLTIEAWVYLLSGAGTGDSTVLARVNGVNTEAQMIFISNTNDPADLRVIGNNTAFTLALGFLPRNAWHHVAVTADGTNWRAYLDGVLKATVAGNQPPNATTPFDYIAAPNVVFHGSIAAVAQYGATLSAAQLAAHAAANSSNAAYKTAVLADSPVGLWMLDETGNMGSRTATLQVSDGTTPVATYPGGTVTGIAPTFSWTWESQAPGTSQGPNAQSNLIHIPDLLLPAGYVLGTVTPDLKAADQWSAIAVWWDDTNQQLIDPLNAYQYPPGALLTYEQIGTQP